jgi:hypothetical protein
VDLPVSDGVSVSRRTQVLCQSRPGFVYGAVTLSGRPSQTTSPASSLTLSAKSYNPTVRKLWFGLFPFRSPLLREYSLFLGLLRCFSSPRSPSHPMCSDESAGALTTSGFPHSDILGYCVCTRLPETFRSVPRPSSAFGAKASSVRP